MDHFNYTKVYAGNFVIAQRIISELLAIGINPIVKDETESGRLAGFGASIAGFQEIYVSNEEVAKAERIISGIQSSMEA